MFISVDLPYVSHKLCLLVLTFSTFLTIYVC